MISDTEFMPTIFSDYRKEKCPDGTSRLVLKHQKDIPQIFGVYVPEWSAKINAGLKQSIQAIEASAGTEIEKRAKSLYDNIQDIDRTARDFFTNAYLQFTTNPCANDKILNSKIDYIFELANKLSYANKQIEKLEHPPVAKSSVTTGELVHKGPGTIGKGRDSAKPTKPTGHRKKEDLRLRTLNNIDKLLGNVKKELRAAK